MSSQAFAIVDATTGRVYFSDELPFVSWADWWEDQYGLKFRLDSRMEEDPKGIFYYLWDGKNLRLIKSIPIGTAP